MHLLLAQQLQVVVAQLNNLGLKIDESKKYEKIRRWWVKPHLLPEMRKIYGAYDAVFIYFKLEDHEEFFHFMGMYPDNFDKLYRLTRVHLTKQTTNMREPLPPELKLAAVIQ